MIKAYFDGCCEPTNPGGYCGFGAVIFKDKERIWEYSGFIDASPTTSNNVGEYKAFIKILEYLYENNMRNEDITVYGDSKLVIEQMFGTWRIKKGFYVPFAHEAQVLVEQFEDLKGQWIPRDDNYLADELSKRELLSRNVKFRIQPA